jgi:hypothetical protein
MIDYTWLEKKRKLSVDSLRPWPYNPRLNPEESHIFISDYAEDMVTESKDDFISLVKSIAEFGYVPADPIIVWKNEDNEKYYVAEGNRRLIALKLLREPEKAPKSIRATVRRISSGINRDSIAKIPVCIAPTFEDAEWYINQRNSTSSLQRRWSRIQQQRWIASLYEKYDGDIDRLTSITRLDSGELGDYIRILKIRDFINEPEVKSKLTPIEFEKANSHKFPITILERFFASAIVREKWGLEFDGMDVNIKSNRQSFFTAYSELIKRIVSNGDHEQKIDTRTITTHLNEILESLPIVDQREVSESLPEAYEVDIISQEDTQVIEESTEPVVNPVILLKNNPNRNKLVLRIYTLHTDSTRLAGLFNEFKSISFKYPNHVAAALRVFLDLAVLKYIETESLETAIKTHYKSDLRDIQLKRRLEYLKSNKFTGRVQTIVSRLIDESQQYSLDVLNGYIHGQDTHYLNKQFLNGFWDALFPLFQTLLDIREENV